MIGVAIKGRPRIGVIHKPYFTSDGFISKSYLGSIETGLFTSEYTTHYTGNNDARSIARNFQYQEPFS